MIKRIIFLISVVFIIQLMAQDKIPAHPDELTFKAIDFTPPSKEDYRHQLPSGVIVYLAEDHSLPLIDLNIIVKTGSYVDPPEQYGLMPMVGSLIRSGGTRNLSPEDFDEAVDFLAANISTSMSDYTSRAQARANFLSKDRQKVMDLFFEMLKYPAFNAERIEVYRDQVLQNLERRNDRTSSILSREWARLIRGDNHWETYQKTGESIKGLTRENLMEAHQKYYHPGNFIVAVAGDFDTDEMLSSLNDYMQDWPFKGIEAPEVPKPDYEPVPGVYMVDKENVNQGRVRLGHLGLQNWHPDEMAVMIMNDILGGSGFTSRITSRVRSDEGLAYSAWSRYSFGMWYEGVFSCGFQSKSATCAQAAEIVLEEIRRIRDQKVSEEELNTAKNYRIEVLPRYFENPRSVVEIFAFGDYIKRPEDYWDTYRSRVKAVTAEDVKRVATAYLHPDKLVILAVGNIDDMQAGDPDKPGYSFQNLAGDKGISVIPLPDPVTMIYPPRVE